MTDRKRTPYAAWFWGSLQLAAVAGVVAGSIAVAEYMRANQPERVQIETSTFVPVVGRHVVSLETRFIEVTKTGSVEPSVYVNLSPSVSGRIDAVAPGLGGGAVFEAGQTLFQINRAELEIELRRREADLAAARANLDIERAQSDNARREWDSFGRGDITDLAARGPQVRSAEAQVLTAEASRDAALLDLERSGFALPFAGRIVDWSLGLGQKVTEGQSYGTAYAFEAVEVTVALSPDELALLDQIVGAPTQITANVLGRDVALVGRVARIEGEVSRTTQLTNLVVVLEAEDVTRHQLQPGTFVSVRLQGSQFEGVAEIPNSALQDGDQLWLIEDGVLRKSTGVEAVLRGRDTTLVTGLSEGDVVAIGTIAGARDGLEVRFEAGAASAPRDLAMNLGDAR